MAVASLPQGRYGLRGSPVDEPQNERQDRTDQESRSDWKIGLVNFLAADDNFEQFRDHDFNDLILRCRDLDRQINPRIPLFNMPDFTVPDDVRRSAARTTTTTTATSTFAIRKLRDLFK